MRETKLKESAVRKKIDLILHNLGWIIDEEDRKCNVITETPKTEEQKEKLKGKEGDYFLYKSGTDNILAVIEAKRPDESIKDALRQGVEFYAVPLGVNIVIATDGAILETYHVKDKTELKIDGEPITDLLSEKDLLRFIEKADIESPQEIKYTKQELIKVFGRANDLLRQEGLREGIERFTEFANILFLKLISEMEEEREKNDEKRILEEQYCWGSFSDLDEQRMLSYINDTILPHLVGRYNHSGDVFETRLKITNPRILKKIVDDLGKLKLINVDSDIKGDAFEYFLKNSVTVGNDLGEYFTPRHIVKLMVKLVDPNFGDKVYDPCCGTAGFLIEAFHHIKSKCSQTKRNIKYLKEKTAYGNELTATAKIAKMNMILTGDGHTNIKQRDSLKYRVKNMYDIVLTNFPFSQRTDYGKLYGFNTEDANPIFIKHVIDSLKNGGRGGLISFQGVLYDKNATYVKIRRYLLEKCELEGVIKLHNYVFQPYTSVNTSILIFKRGKQTKKVWFFLVDEDGFEKTGSIKGRRPIGSNDLKLLQESWDSKATTEKSWIVDIETIRVNNYNLNAETYKPRRKERTRFASDKLSECVEVIRERGEERKIPYIEIGDIELYGKTYLLKDKSSTSTCKVARKNNIIISTVRPTRGAVSYITEDEITVSSAFLIVKSNTQELMNRFLFFLLAFNNRFYDYLRSQQQGATYPTIEEAKILNFPIPRLPIDLQNEKLQIFEKRLSIIQATTQSIKSIESNLFDPFIFEDKFDKMPLKDLIYQGKMQNGLYKEKQYYGSGTPIVRIDNFYNGKLLNKEFKKVVITEEEKKRYALKMGDILLNRVNSEDYVGKCCVFDDAESISVFESNIMRFRVIESKVIPEYIVFYFSSIGGRRQILSKIKRAVN
ncbi:MAG: N-6 DNA methylase [candidate division Zixibacteria bacterium]|nr:N-6 DNA methylase [candidate division Zixibacteria bacterium]